VPIVLNPLGEFRLLFICFIGFVSLFFSVVFVVVGILCYVKRFNLFY
jgi:hypothetical protein